MPWITKDGRRIFVGGGPNEQQAPGALQRPTGGLPGLTEGAQGNQKLSAEAINQTKKTTSLNRVVGALEPQSKAYHLGFAAHHEQEASSREKLMQNPNVSSSTYDRLAADSHRLAANAHHEAAASFGTEGARVSHPDHLSQSGTPHTGSSAGLVVGGKHYPAGDMHAVMTNVPALHKQLLSQGFKEDFAPIDNRGEGINTTTRSYTHPTMGTVTFDHTGNGQGRHQVLLNLEDMRR